MEKLGNLLSRLKLTVPQSPKEEQSPERPLLESFEGRRSRLERDEMGAAVQRGRERSPEPATPPRRYERTSFALPQAAELKDRVFLLCQSGFGKGAVVSIVWVDDQHSCERFHARDSGAGLWHLAQAVDRMVVRRCPALLSPEERERLRVDSPKGDFRRVIREETRKAQASSHRRKESPEAAGESSWR